MPGRGCGPGQAVPCPTGQPGRKTLWGAWIMIVLEPRPQASRLLGVLSPVIAILLMLGAGAIMLAAMGRAPGEALYVYFFQPIHEAWLWLTRPDERAMWVYTPSEVLVKAIPLALIGAGLTVCFRANVWNIGAAGQYTLGAIFGGAVALYGPQGPAWLVLILYMLAGILGGALWAAIPALLRTRFNANEILVSLMLTYVATLLLDWLVRGPWKDPAGMGFPESRDFTDAYLMPVLLQGTRLHLGLIIAIVAALAVCWIGRVGVVRRIGSLAADGVVAGARRADECGTHHHCEAAADDLRTHPATVGPARGSRAAVSPTRGPVCPIPPTCGRSIRAGMDSNSLVVGIDVGGTTDNVTVVTHDGRFLIDRMLEVPSRVLEGPDAALDALRQVYTLGLETVGATEDQVVAVGLDTPGPASATGVLSARGATNFSAPEWWGYDIRSALETELERPVVYSNDGNAAAMYAHYAHLALIPI